MDYAEHDEYGFDLSYLKEPITVEEVGKQMMNSLVLQLHLSSLKIKIFIIKNPH